MLAAALSEKLSRMEARLDRFAAEIELTHDQMLQIRELLDRFQGDEET